jgi:hypothetical protein
MALPVATGSAFSMLRSAFQQAEWCSKLLLVVEKEYRHQFLGFDRESSQADIVRALACLLHQRKLEGSHRAKSGIWYRTIAPNAFGNVASGYDIPGDGLPYGGQILTDNVLQHCGSGGRLQSDLSLAAGKRKNVFER